MDKKTVIYHLNIMVSYLVLSVVIAAVWATFEKQLSCIFDVSILPVLAIFKANIWNKILVCTIGFIALYDVIRKTIQKHLYHPVVIYGLLWLMIIVGYYRTKQVYQYESLFGEYTYVDALLTIGSLYVLSFIVTGIWRIFSYYKELKDSTNTGILPDAPIESIDEDELDWVDEINKLLDIIQALPKSQSLSISINAQWGAGKTSFLRILQQSVDPKTYEVIYFNPRESKSANEIQEDFFQQMISVLSKYDGRTEKNLRKYMASLQIIDDRSWIAKLLNIYTVWNKESYRNKIKKICKNLPVKILVIIDDFDRLLPAEIIEALKLIGSNASFSNFVFLTAYDKDKVGEVLKNIGKTKDAYFTDKYFELEYALPIRPYSYVRKYLVNNIVRMLRQEESTRQYLSKQLQKDEDLFQTIIPTIRDAKRYLNQMYLDYRMVDGEVWLYDFIYVQLIKYKYHQEYLALCRKDYLEINPLRNYNAFFLKKDIAESKDIQSIEILKRLFYSDRAYENQLYRHIYEVQSFDNYFVNKLYGKLTIRDMRQIFDVVYEEMCKKVDAWLETLQETEDFVNYLQFLRFSEFGSKEMFDKYAATVAYLVTKTKGEHGQTMLHRLLYIDNLKACEKKYQISIDAHKLNMLRILTDVNVDSNLNAVRQLHYFYINKAMEEDAYMLKDADIWPRIQARFIEILEKPIEELDDKDVEDYLHQCVVAKGTKDRLDAKCCEKYREYLYQKPNYYMEHFVRTTMESSSPEWNIVGCDPYYRNIFKTDEEFARYAEYCKKKGVPKSDLVLNFMALYAANEYNNVEFQGQGNVQDKINADFVREAQQVRAMRGIEKQILKLKQEREQGKDISKKVETLQKKLKQLDLRISLKDKLIITLNEMSSK